MPRQGKERVKTRYPGVYSVEVGKGRLKDEVYYICYRRNGKQIEEKAGRHADAMTAAKASGMRADRIKGKELPNTEKRKAARAEKIAEAGKWTLSRLWDEYEKTKPKSVSLEIDKYRFRKHAKPTLGNKEPHEIIRLDVDRLRVNLSKTLKPQTVKHVLALLKRIIRFGVKRQYCRELPFPMDPVKVDNQTTEDLTPTQLKNLLKALEESTDIEAANIMRIAMFTGMRRGELFKLEWNDIDFDRGFITIGHDPKGGVSQKIPLNDQARAVLKSHPATAKNVFVNSEGNPFKDISLRVNAIKTAAGIGADFRSLHGLRHAYASMLASSGQVDMYTLQKLLTHKSPIMTQRYAHLRDDTMRKASTLAGNIIQQAADSMEEHEGEAVTG